MNSILVPRPSAETLAHERKVTLATFLGMTFVLAAVVGTGLGVWKCRTLFPDTFGHVGKWPIGIIAALIVGYLAFRLAVFLERKWLKVPKP